MNEDACLLLQCPMGSVFSPFSDERLRALSAEGGRTIAVSGKVMRSGVLDVPEGASLRDVITLAGGILGGRPFKAAQLGMPFGRFVTAESLEEPFGPELFPAGALHTLIVLSEEDCIVQHAIFYLDFLLCRVRQGRCTHYADAAPVLAQMRETFDRIAKGRAEMQDLFRLREAAQMLTQADTHPTVIAGILHSFYDELREHIEHGRCEALQCNHLIKLAITEKCIGCNRCQAVCPVDCIAGETRQQHRIDYVRCTHCGACVSVCPVSAITSGNNTVLFLRDLAKPDRVVITQMAPSVRVTIGEAFGFAPGENIQGRLTAGLKQLGVDYVFDTTWAADLTVMEEAAELQQRVERWQAGDKTVKLPILTSCCPAWVKFIEQNYGDMLDVPSSAKSPMEMFAAVAKNIWAKERGIPREKLVCVAIMPCIAKKYEASRPEFSSGLDYDVDYVITASELIDLFKSTGIDLASLVPAPVDPVMGEYTGGGVIFGRTGGVIEAATRVAVERMTGQHLENVEFTCLRGWEGFRSCEVQVGELKLRIGIAHGLKEAAKMLNKIRAGEEFYHAIEIMACTGGCVGGGGQPKIRGSREPVLRKRMEGLDEIDRDKALRRSSENPEVQALYAKYFGEPLSHTAHELLHTRYFIRRNN